MERRHGMAADAGSSLSIYSIRSNHCISNNKLVKVFHKKKTKHRDMQ